MVASKTVTGAIFAGLLLAAPQVRAQACQLCAKSDSHEAVAQKAISISVETMLDFSTAAHTNAGSGSITVDPRTGSRQLSGLVGLSGPALRGTVTIIGQPFARLSISLPRSVQLNSNLGAVADVTDIRTDLSPSPMLGADGRLVFSFGGKLTVREEAAGDFKGRIPITADYQ